MSNKSGFAEIVMLLILILLVIGLVYAVNRKSTYNTVKGETVSESPIDAKVIVIDKCEYLMYRSYNGVAEVTHKGNCSNPIHVYRTEK